MRGLWTGLEEDSRQQARANGNTIIDNFDRKPFEKAMNSVHADAVSDPDMIQLIERIRQDSMSSRIGSLSPGADVHKAGRQAAAEH